MQDLDKHLSDGCLAQEVLPVVWGGPTEVLCRSNQHNQVPSPGQQGVSPFTGKQEAQAPAVLTVSPWRPHKGTNDDVALSSLKFIHGADGDFAVLVKVRFQLGYLKCNNEE